VSNILNLQVIIVLINTGMFFFGSLFPTFFLDRFGRRRPMMIGCALCGISMMMIAALLSPQGQGNEALAQRASSASVAFFFTVRHIYPPLIWLP
jgi:MFS family permease